MKMKCKAKEILVESIQYNGENYQEIQKFVPNHVFQLQDCLLVSAGFRNNIIINTNDFLIKDSFGNISCNTPEQFYRRYEVLENNVSKTRQ